MSWLLDWYGWRLRVRARSDREAAEKLIRAAKKTTRTE